MDGLLLDSEKLALDAFESTCAKFKLGDLVYIYMKCIGTNWELANLILKDEFEGIMDHEEFILIWDRVYNDLTQEKPIPLKKGAKQLLDHIDSMGIQMAVASSTNTESAKSILTQSGILYYFDLIIGGEQVSNSKPNPEVYLKVASTLGVNPEFCIALEDSPNGVKSAVAANMKVIQIPDLNQPDESLLQLGHIVLNSLSDVISYDFGKHDTRQNITN